MQIKTKIVTLFLSLCPPTLPLLANAETAPAAQVDDGVVITVNFNTASAEELATLLKGIGLKSSGHCRLSKANGPFTHIHDPTNVKGLVKRQCATMPQGSCYKLQSCVS